jgi:RNA 2',3'-cyclic 3'-phosphodiesterase
VARLFVAVRPPEGVLDAVERVVAPARRRMVGPRWTTRDQWHLTLQFLGWVEDATAVAAALEAMGAGIEFPVRVGGGGAFPRPSRGRVVWLGLLEGESDVAGLAAGVNEALRPLGFEPEKRPFHSHLTLARLRQPADVSSVVEAIGDDPVGAEWMVREVVLYQSHLSPKGARYEPVAQVPLEG